MNWLVYHIVSGHSFFTGDSASASCSICLDTHAANLPSYYCLVLSHWFELRNCFFNGDSQLLLRRDGCRRDFLDGIAIQNIMAAEGGPWNGGCLAHRCVDRIAISHQSFPSHCPESVDDDHW